MSSLGGSCNSGNRSRSRRTVSIVSSTDRVVWDSHTTLSVDETMETVRRLRERFPLLQDPPSDDIFYATQNRQVAVKELAPECDLVVVVGSANSSNSVRLVEVALHAGAVRSYNETVSSLESRVLVSARRRRAACRVARRDHRG